MNVSKIDSVIETSSLKLISAIFSNSSRAKTFYCYLLKKHCCDKLRNHTDLIARVRIICSKHNVSLFKYILDMLTMYKFSSNHPLRRKTDYVIVLGKYCLAAIRMTGIFYACC